jgi:3-hydroxyanthranilate 3,4-dioxygenase
MMEHLFDVLAWVEANRDDPERALMNHQLLWRDAFIVMLFNGATPPDRSDFHINASGELFYQLEGDMRCQLRQPDGTITHHVVGPGQIFYIPPMMPHLNQRDEGSTGLVIHQQRPEGALDGMMWSCRACGHELHRVEYLFTELQENLKTHIRAFLASESLRTCSECGDVFPAGRGYL